jgi:hypothetical protein
MNDASRDDPTRQPSSSSNQPKPMGKEPDSPIILKCGNRYVYKITGRDCIYAEWPLEELDRQFIVGLQYTKSHFAGKEYSINNRYPLKPILVSLRDSDAGCVCGSNVPVDMEKYFDVERAVFIIMGWKRIQDT